MSNKDQKKKAKKGFRAWLKEIVIFASIALIVSLAIDLWRSQAIVSGQAPELITQSVSGNKIDLLTMSHEKPVLVYFWATWCTVCKTVSPSVDFIADNYQVVTVALSSGKSQQVQQYLNAKEYQFNVINDPKGEISRSWGISVTPTLFVIDKGEITSVTTGFTTPIGMWLRLFMA